MSAIAPYQIKNIRILQKKLGISENDFRAVLHGFKKDGRPIRSTKDLTSAQAERLIGMWRSNCEEMGITVNLYRADFKKVASQNQIDKIRVHAIRCALHYWPLPQFNVETPAGSLTMEGPELQKYCLQLWRAKSRLPQPVLKVLFEKWINPKSNQFLVEGGFRLHVQNMAVCMYPNLTVDEAQYLITRFLKIHEQLDMLEHSN